MLDWNKNILCFRHKQNLKISIIYHCFQIMKQCGYNCFVWWDCFLMNIWQLLVFLYNYFILICENMWKRRYFLYYITILEIIINTMTMSCDKKYIYFFMASQTYINFCYVRNIIIECDAYFWTMSHTKI